jgi:hypothetical protein
MDEGVRWNCGSDPCNARGQITHYILSISGARETFLEDNSPVIVQQSDDSTTRLSTLQHSNYFASSLEL